jgi:hypothetical protein
MDKVSRIVAAALLASTMAYSAPAFAVDTTAEEFVVSLSADFSRGDLATVQAKLQELQALGLDGIRFDGVLMISIEQLIALLNQVQAGSISGATAASTLLAYVEGADVVVFVNGGIVMTIADLNVGTVPGSVFPAGSAG